MPFILFLKLSNIFLFLGAVFFVYVIKKGASPMRLYQNKNLLAIT